MLLADLETKKLISTPHFLVLNTHYQTIMGSTAYGVSTDTSDIDIYGFCIPPKEVIFPHLAGVIQGFDNDVNPFWQWQQHGISDPDKPGVTYDFSIYNIVKYFRLCADCNPNMIDSLFTPVHCHLQVSKIGAMVKSARKIFLNKRAWHTYKGYAYAQMSKINNKDKKGSRLDLINKYGYDTKFAYHVVRLMLQIEQIMLEGDLDLMRNAEQLKAIRNGEWTEHQLKMYFTSKERELESLYISSSLLHKPNAVAIKQLLIDCLEEHYGNLSNVIVQPDKYTQAIDDIKAIISSL